MAKKSVRRRVHPSITNVIGYLAARHERSALCDEGQKRLAWWKRNGRKFKDARAAIASWDGEDIARYADYLGLDYPSGRMTSVLDNLQSAIGDLQDVIDADGGSKPAKKLMTRLVTVEKQAEAASKDVLSAWAKTIDLDTWAPPKDRW